MAKFSLIIFWKYVRSKFNSECSFSFYRQLLTEEELSEVKEACNMAIDLNACKLRIYEFVESRMTFIAPNLSVIIGASTAAKLMGKYLIVYLISKV